MNKLFTRIGVAFAGIAMAIGVGVAVGQGSRAVERVDAAVSIDTTEVSTIAAGTYVVTTNDSNKSFYWAFPNSNSKFLKNDKQITLIEYGNGKTVTSISGIPEANVVTLTQVVSGKYSISALDANATVKYIGWSSSTEFTSSTTAPTSSSTKYLWTFAKDTTNGGFRITNVNNTDRKMKVYSSGPDVRPYTTQSYTDNFHFYPATITSNTPTFDISSAALTFNAGGVAQTLTASNYQNFSGTPTLSVSYQYDNGLVTTSISNNTITVTPVAVGSIGTYTTDKLYVTATYNDESYTRTVSLTVRKQSITLDKTSANIVAGIGAATVSATPVNFDGTPSYNWTIISDTNGIISSLGDKSTSTVTINPVSTHRDGSATVRVTATYSSNLTQTATADVTVSMIETKAVYNVSFTVASSSTTAMTTSNWDDYFSGDASDLSCTNIGKVYPEATNQVKFGSSSAVGTVTLKSSGDLVFSRVIIHAASFVSTSDVVDANSAIIVNNSESQSTTESYAYYVFDLAEASDTITIKGESTTTGRFYVDNIILIMNGASTVIQSYGYAATFMNSLDKQCEELAVTTSTWSTLSSAWSAMETAATGSQTYFLGKTASASGDVIQKALSRYDYIVGKYNKALKLSGYNDFMSRDPAVVGSGSIAFNVPSETSTTTTFIVVIAAVSTLAIGGFFFLRKRKIG